MQGESTPPGTEPSAALWATLPVPACCHPVVTARTLPQPLVSGAARTLLPRADGAQGRVYPPGPAFLSLIQCTRLPTAPLCRAPPFYYGQRHSGHTGNLQGGGRAEPQPMGAWLLAAGSTKTSRSPDSWLPTVLNCHRALVRLSVIPGPSQNLTVGSWLYEVCHRAPARGCWWNQDVALKGKECFPQGWSGQEACCCTLGHASLLAGDFTLPWPLSETASLRNT